MSMMNTVSKVMASTSESLEITSFHRGSAPNTMCVYYLQPPIHQTLKHCEVQTKINEKVVNSTPREIIMTGVFK